ncbi:MAG TPA: FecR/PupR family sigma factor regulator, partial [Methyloradius sp.]
MVLGSKKKALRETATTWFVRLQEMDSDHPDRSRFEAWLMSDPSNQEAYSEVTRLWEKLDSTSQLEGLTSKLQQKVKTERTGKIKTALTALSIVVLVASGVYGRQVWQS